MKNIINLSMLFLIGLGLQAQTQSFSLEEAVQYAIKNNTNIKISSLESKTADATVKEYRAIGIPQVTGSINYQYYFAVPQQPIADFITPSVYRVLFDESVIPERDLGPPNTNNFSFFQPHNLTAGVEINSLIFDGSYIYGLKAAKLYRELALKQINLTIEDVKSKTTKAYLSVLIAEENLEVVENNLSVIKKSLSDAQAMYENGFIESLDVDRLQLSHDKLELEISNLTNLIEISKNVLKFQMEYPISDEIQLSDDMDSVMELNNSLLVKTPGLEYSNRVEYDLLNTSIHLNQLNLKSINAKKYPSVRAFGNVQSALQREDLFDSNEAGWLNSAFAGVGINVPIYDGGSRSAQSQNSKIEIERLQLQKKQLETSIRMQVSNAELALGNAYQSLLNSQDNLNTTERIYRKTNIKFQEGVGSSIEITQAEAELYSAQGEYINSLYELVNAQTELKIALGKL